MLRTVCAPVWGISVPGYRKGAGGTRVNTGPATGNNNGVQGYTKLYPMLGVGYGGFELGWGINLQRLACRSHPRKPGIKS